MTQWFRDETFWVTLYPFLFPEERWADAAEEVDGLLSLVPHRGDRVLDLCCGPGRHSLALAQRNLRVTGVDASEFLLKTARQRAKEAGVDIEWVRSDMREFLRVNEFDLAISMFSSFGYFEDEEDDARVLRNVHASLKTDGALLMELAGKEWLARDFQPTISGRSPDGTLLVQRHEVIDDWERIANEWIVVCNGIEKRFRFNLRIFSGREIRDRLTEAGFSRVRLYGDLDGAAYGLDSKRLVAVAVKERVDE